MQHQQEHFSLSCSLAQAVWEPWPVLFQVQRGALDWEGRPSRSWRRGEPGGIQNTAVQHSSPEIKSSIWSPPGGLWCMITRLSHSALTFQTLVCGRGRVSLSGVQLGVALVAVGSSASHVWVCPSSCHPGSCASWAPRGVSPFWPLQCASSFLDLLTAFLSSSLACVCPSGGLAPVSVSLHRFPAEHPLQPFWFRGDVSYLGAPPRWGHLPVCFCFCVHRYVFLFWF